jgi:hypothetical protein
MKLNWQRAWLRFPRNWLLAVLLGFGFDHCRGAVQPAQPRLNILLIRADEMGFRSCVASSLSDLGAKDF